MTSEGTKELRKLFALLSSSAGETLASLVGRSVAMRSTTTRLLDTEAVLNGLRRTYVVARGGLDKGYAGKSMALMFEVQDAIAMSGMLMMTPDEVIEQRRTTGIIEGEDVEAFGELGNVLFSGIGDPLRANVDDIDIRFERQGVCKPGVDVDGILDEGAVVAHEFAMQVGDYPESTGFMVIDLGTAEAWNKGPIEVEETAGNTDDPGEQTGGATSASVGEDDGLEAIPAAPIRGALAAFLSRPDVFRIVRRSCRRTGLELHRHGRGEIPNPAAHRGEIVLLDVPPGEDRQFDWCRRIKDFSAENKVVLLLHHPSRNRVTQAFLSRADAILGYPCEEGQLSQKLDGLLSEAPVPEE